MPGAKATKPHSIGDVDNRAAAPRRVAANASPHEPSMDEILASIRQIISDQNAEADREAEKAAAAVANPQPENYQVDSIIGSLGASHWSGEEAPGDEDTLLLDVSPPEPSILLTTEKSTDVDKLISLIAAAPSIPPVLARQHRTHRKATKPDHHAAIVDDAPAGPGAQAELYQAKGSMQPAPVVNKAVQSKVPPQKNYAAKASPSAVVAPKPAVPIAKPQQATMPQNKSEAAGDSQKVVSGATAIDRFIARKKLGGAEIPPAIPAKQPQPTVNSSPPGQNQTPTPQPAATGDLADNVMLRNHVHGEIQAMTAADKAAPAAAMQTRSKPPLPPVSSRKPAVAASPEDFSIAVNAAVASSFERLTGMIMDGRKDELDRIVGGIMRPMLREWLEDNLPSLVERIVREEIERVSRGTH